MVDVLIVGAGLAGAVCAERLASAGARVLVIEKRAHIGGNCYDEYDEHGVLVQRYGAHIFHTNNRRVVEYLSRFTTWRRYQHRVLASLQGLLVPLPLNLVTLEMLYGRPFDAEAARAWFAGASRRECEDTLNTFGGAMRARVGDELYEWLYADYSRKQWGCDPDELSVDLANRIPIRMNRDGRYFTDRWQVMPCHGFTHLVRGLLAHARISVLLQAAYGEIEDAIAHKVVIYTGSLDEWFGADLGPLPYRSATFEWALHGTPQPCAVVNYQADYSCTRSIDFRQLTGQDHPLTVVASEYPREHDGHTEPFWPMPTQSAEALGQRYRERAAQVSHVHFLGRLGQYQYLNMDEVVADALTLTDRLLKERSA